MKYPKPGALVGAPDQKGKGKAQGVGLNYHYAFEVIDERIQQLMIMRSWVQITTNPKYKFVID